MPVESDARPSRLKTVLSREGLHSHELTGNEKSKHAMGEGKQPDEGKNARGLHSGGNIEEKGGTASWPQTYVSLTILISIIRK